MRFQKLTSIALVICLTVTLGLGNMLISKQAIAGPEYPDCCGTEYNTYTATQETVKQAKAKVTQLKIEIAIVNVLIVASIFAIDQLIRARDDIQAKIGKLESAYERCKGLFPEHLEEKMCGWIDKIAEHLREHVLNELNERIKNAQEARNQLEKEKNTLKKEKVTAEKEVTKAEAKEQKAKEKYDKCMENLGEGCQ